MDIFTSKNKEYKVLVANPGAPYSHQIALAMQRAGLLQKYATCFYYKPSSAAGRLIRCLPRRMANRLERQLLRRRNDDLDDNLICTFPLWDLIYVLSTRLAFARKWAKQMAQWRSNRFDEDVASVVKAIRPEALISFNGGALDTFKACREVRTIAILEQSTGLLKSAIKIYREEAELHPEFADSLAIDVPEWLVERCTAEALAADKVLVASEYVRGTLIDNGVSSSRIAICPYGVDTGRFRPVEKPDGGVFRILFVGSISQSKGIKYLLEAFRQLNLPNAELVLVGGVAGSGDGLKPYRDLFRHITHLPFREVHSVFQNADIFVYPSLHEGSALAIYEALASGLPVIATPNSGSVVRDGVDGYIVPIRDIEALKEKILLLYQDRELRCHMGVQARVRAESHTWQAYHQRLAALVLSFIEEGVS